MGMLRSVEGHARETLCSVWLLMRMTTVFLFLLRSEPLSAAVFLLAALMGLGPRRGLMPGTHQEPRV